MFHSCLKEDYASWWWDEVVCMGGWLIAEMLEINA
jgi:hypothetical protein